MKTSVRAVGVLKRLEGFRSKAYLDIAGVWTIGYGFTKGVKEGDTVTLARAEARLHEELREYEEAVFAATGGNVTRNQFDAMVLLAYNIGISGFRRSTVLRAHNRGDHEAAARAFALWNKAGGVESKGLVRRRALEAAIYLEPEVDDVSDPVEGPVLEMPQKVDPERPMTASTVNRASIAAGGTAVVATVAETARTATDIKESADKLGPAWLLPALVIIVVGLCGYIVWERVKQRRGGWA